MRDKNYNIFFYIIRLITLFFISVTLCYALFSILHYKITVAMLIKINLVLLIIVILFYYNKYSYLGSFAIIFVFLTRFILTKESEGINLNSYISEFFDAVILSFKTHKFHYDFQYIAIIIISFIIINTLYIMDFRLKRFNPLVVIIPGIALYVIPYVISDVDNYIGFVIFCITSIFYLFIHQYKYLRHKKTRQYILFICVMLIFSLLTMYISIFMKDNYKPSMLWVNGVVTKFKEISPFKNKGHDRTILYSSDSNLESVINKDQTIVLEVYSTKPKYLKSKTFYEFKDNTWLNNFSEGKEVYIDKIQDNSIAQNTIGINLLNQLSLGKSITELNFNNMVDESLLFTKERLDIEFVNILSNNLFVPNNYTSISINSPSTDQRKYFVNDSNDIYTESLLNEGYTYSINTLTPNIETIQFHNFLRESYTGLDRDLISMQQDDIMYQPDPIASTEYTINIPYNITDRTIKLAYEITKDYNTNYDKVRAIEKYLATNYNYNLDVEPVPNGSEYVDYFLFESKEGYCTYFATSMVILTRAIKIPSRYVVGYKLPQSLSDDLPFMDTELMGDPNQYTIRGENAHAWVEVYFEGYGWIQFEPTAPFFTQYPNSLKINYDDYEIINQPNKQNQVNENKSSYSYLDNVTDILLLILLVVLPIILIIVRKIKYFCKKDKLKIVYNYKRILIVYSLLGYRIQKNETARNFSYRVYDRLAAFDDSFIRVTKLFEEAKYGKSQMSKEGVMITKKYLSFLQAKLWEKSIIKYIYYKLTS